MKRRFDTVILNFDGKPVPDQDGKSVTLGSICVTVLMTTDLERADGKEKFERAEFARRIHKATVIDVTAEEISLLKRLLGIACPPVVVWPAYKLLETEETQTEVLSNADNP